MSPYDFFDALHADKPRVHDHTYVIHVKYSERNVTKNKRVLHELGFPLGLCQLCKAMRTNRVLGALRALLRALCGLGGWRRTRLGQCNGRHVRCETRNPNIVIAFYECS